MPALVIGTSNPGKAGEFRELFAAAPLLADCRLSIATLADVAARDATQDDGDPEIAETGATLAENAAIKAAAYARRFREWTLADDTGLEVDAIDGAPGLLTARFAGPGATAAENRRRLLDVLAATPRAAALVQRGAQFVCHLALADPAGEIRAASVGCCRGRIRFEPIGGGGFGYDSLFELVEYHQTLAELGAAAKGLLSHRARAVERIAPQLAALFGRADVL